jgi:hypothetical protein
MAAITRANDPFWNIRAFDTALARHDGYVLSSFICGLNQLILDDITSFNPRPPPHHPRNKCATITPDNCSGPETELTLY